MPEIAYIRSGVEPAEPSVASGLRTTPATYGVQSGPLTKRPPSLHHPPVFRAGAFQIARILVESIVTLMISCRSGMGLLV